MGDVRARSSRFTVLDATSLQLVVEVFERRALCSRLVAVVILDAIDEGLRRSSA